jgi:hypothetical protein
MTQLTAIKQLATVLTWSRALLASLNNDLMQRSIRALEINIDDTLDPQRISHASQALLRTDQVFPRVIRGLLWFASNTRLLTSTHPLAILP